MSSANRQLSAGPHQASWRKSGYELLLRIRRIGLGARCAEAHSALSEWAWAGVGGCCSCCCNEADDACESCLRGPRTPQRMAKTTRTKLMRSHPFFPKLGWDLLEEEDGEERNGG